MTPSATSPSTTPTSATSPSTTSTSAVTPSTTSTPASTSDSTSISTPTPTSTSVSAPARPATNFSTLASPIPPTTDSNPITTYICASIVGTALLAGIAFAMHVRSIHVHRAQLTQSKRVNILNPLNQTPVSVPWSHNETPWKLSESVRTGFAPMHIRGIHS